jgi:hypothetical protein
MSQRVAQAFVAHQAIMEDWVNKINAVLPAESRRASVREIQEAAEAAGWDSGKMAEYFYIQAAEGKTMLQAAAALALSLGPQDRDEEFTDEASERLVDILKVEDWWRQRTAEDFDAIEDKIGEYTASDLILMGQFMEHWLGLPEGSGAEAACQFYLLGKVARAVAAYREGRLPSEDTLMDETVYSLMTRRIRETGRWP